MVPRIILGQAEIPPRPEFVAEPATPAPVATPPNIRELVITLFELGREVTSVLDLDELLQKIPQLIARITEVPGVRRLPARSARRGAVDRLRRRLSRRRRLDAAREGRAGRCRRRGRRRSTPILVNDVTRIRDTAGGAGLERGARRAAAPQRPRHRRAQPAERHVGQFTETDEALLRQFGAHVAVAIENARLFEHEREYTSTLETLSEIAREFGAILNLDELLTRIANLTRRVIDYRTFGILLVNEETGELDMKVAVRYGDKVNVPRVKRGAASSATPRCTRRRCSCPTCRGRPRYIKVVDDARSELVIPLLLHDRCLGVFDLESPELDAFSKSDVEILTLLASQAAVWPSENAPLRNDPIERRAPREGNPLRAARAGRAAARCAAQSA